MSKRVLITGGSGFVGANLARRAAAEGHDVHLLLRAAHDTWRVRDLPPGVVRHEADVMDRSAVQAAVAAIRPQWAFHLAAYGAYAHQRELDCMMATNFWGCVHLLDACRDAGVEAFVNAGSSSEYGYTDRAARETDRLQPNSHYALSKAAATHYCQLSARTAGVNAVTVRLYSVYGPFEAPGRLIPTLLVHGRRGQLPPLVMPHTARDFVYIDDAVDALLHVAASPAVVPGSVYNVCTGVQTRIADIVDSVRRLLDVSAEPTWGSLPQRPWDTDVWVGSPATLEAELGWRARTALVDGLQKTIDWLCDEPARLQFYEERILRSVPV